MISKLILGTAQFGQNYGINNLVGQPTSRDVYKILSEAYERGIRILDSAEAYGNSHKIIGEYHFSYPNNKFNIITKINAIPETSQIEKLIDRFLEQLKVTQIFGLLFHSYKSYQSNLRVFEILQNIQSKGKINYLGVSIYSNYEFEKVIDDDKISIIQLPFNLLDNYSYRGLLIEKAKAQGKIIHTRSAFLQGLFFMNPYLGHPVVQALKEQLLDINEIAQRSLLSIENLAISYCLSKVNIDGVIIGVDSSEQLRINLKNSERILPIDEIKKIESIRTENLDLLNPSLWK